MLAPLAGQRPVVLCAPSQRKAGQEQVSGELGSTVPMTDNLEVVSWEPKACEERGDGTAAVDGSWWGYYLTQYM